MFRLRLIVATVGLLACAAVAPAANVPVVPGLNAIAIPFVPSLNYNATNIFSTPYEGEIIYRWNAPVGAWLIFTYSEDVSGWVSDSLPINPTFSVGEGIYYQALVAQTFVANFDLVPEIAELPIPPPLLPNRYYFKGSPTGEGATYEDIFGGAPINETALFRFIPGGANINPTGPDYRVYHFKDQVWTPETPVLDPLEPVFVVYPYLSLKYTLTADRKTISFTWPTRGKLEQATLPGGPWELVATDANTYSITPSVQSNGARYYRVKE